MNKLKIHDRIIFENNVGWIQIIYEKENIAMVDFLNGKRLMVNLNLLKKDGFKNYDRF